MSQTSEVGLTIEEDKKNRSDDGFIDMEWDLESSSWVSLKLLAIQNTVGSITEKKSTRKYTMMGSLLLIFLLYNAYLVGAIAYYFRHKDDDSEEFQLKWEWCDGHGFLIIITAIVYYSLTYYYVLKPYLGKAVVNNVFRPVGNVWELLWSKVVFRLIFSAILLGGLITFLILDTKDNRRRLISASGIPILILIGLLLSKNPARIVWRHVFWGTALQFIFGLIVLRWEVGKNVVKCLSDKVAAFLAFTDAGSGFVFGFLATGYNSTAEGVSLPDEVILNSTFAFGVLSVIFWFSFVVGILYHLGAMTWVVIKIGWLLQISIGTTAAESLNAAANIFLGQTEAPLVIKPFINDLTKSELHSVMTGGFATIAGTVMGAYISFGIDPSHLLSASVMSAPAALAFSKLIYPETKISRTTSKQIYENRPKRKSGGVLSAASEATSQAIYLIANIIASLVAVTAFVAFADTILSWFGLLVGFSDLSFQWILGKLFYPFAFIIGIDVEELETVGRLLGIKTVVNEFVAYQQLAELGDKLSKRSQAITTYALCSFANFSSIGIQLGGLGAIAPKRKNDLAAVVWRAFIAGNAAALMTACIAGTLTDEPGYNG